MKRTVSVCFPQEEIVEKICQDVDSEQFGLIGAVVLFHDGEESLIEPETGVLKSSEQQFEHSFFFLSAVWSHCFSQQREFLTL